jgi:hypothetical protein
MGLWAKLHSNSNSSKLADVKTDVKLLAANALDVNRALPAAPVPPYAAAQNVETLTSLAAGDPPISRQP